MKNIKASLVSALMIASGFSVLLSAEGAKADPQVNVNVYTGFTMSGGGKPFTGLFGSFTSFDIMNLSPFHPFGLANFGADFTGVLSVLSGGPHSFTLCSDDGSQLLISAALVVNNGGPHGPACVGGSATLSPGTYPFEVPFFECCGNPSFVQLFLPTEAHYGFVGTVGDPNCHGKSVSSLAQQYGGMSAAASALGFPSVKALQNAIAGYCAG